MMGRLNNCHCRENVRKFPWTLRRSILVGSGCTMSSDLTKAVASVLVLGGREHHATAIQRLLHFLVTVVIVCGRCVMDGTVAQTMKTEVSA
jgi:hypothetical protein|eukprot:SAG11_NODE_404_length_9736_cov_20.243022_5_plen_91_part_00